MFFTDEKQTLGEVNCFNFVNILNNNVLIRKSAEALLTFAESHQVQSACPYIVDLQSRPP